MKIVAAVTAAALVLIPTVSFAQGAGGAGSGAGGAARVQEARALARAAACQALERRALARGPLSPRKGLVIQVRGKDLLVQVRAELTTIQCPALVKEVVENNGRPSLGRTN